MTQDELEKAIIEKCLHGDDPYFAELRAQIPYLQLTKREIDEAGFFSYYSVPDDKKVERVYGLIDDVGSTNDKQSILFKLNIEDGKIDVLEGYAIPYGWPENYDTLDPLTYAFQDERRRYRPLGNAQLPKETGKP